MYGSVLLLGDGDVEVEEDFYITIESCFVPYEDGSWLAGLGLLHIDEIRKLPTEIAFQARVMIAVSKGRKTGKLSKADTYSAKTGHMQAIGRGIKIYIPETAGLLLQEGTVRDRFSKVFLAQVVNAINLHSLQRLNLREEKVLPPRFSSQFLFLLPCAVAMRHGCDAQVLRSQCAACSLVVHRLAMRHLFAGRAPVPELCCNLFLCARALPCVPCTPVWWWASQGARD